MIVPQTNVYPMYYLAEWRNNSGFDSGLKYPYPTMYNDDDEWEVDRCAYTVPGMLLWLRNGARDFDYTLNDSWFDPPSLRPEARLARGRQPYWPLAGAIRVRVDGTNLRLTSRCQPANATFTLQPTTPFTIRLGYDPNDPTRATDIPLETKTFEPLPAVSQFHDSLGYYPGLARSRSTVGLWRR